MSLTQSKRTSLLLGRCSKKIFSFIAVYRNMTHHYISKNKPSLHFSAVQSLIFSLRPLRLNP
jgi:hypothetical protein